MPPKSGVFVIGFVPSSEVISDMSFPGDINLLVIPYEGDDLVIARTLAIEIKVVRASFENQGKSPDRFGFSQAQSLLDHGFPYAGVLHLIVSDTSPEDAWEEVQVARVIDEEGRVEFVGTTKADMMPANLISRSYGRLKANRQNETIGIIGSYFARWKMGTNGRGSAA